MKQIVVVFLICFLSISCCYGQNAELKCVYTVGWCYYNQFETLLKAYKFYGYLDYVKSSGGFSLDKQFYVTFYSEEIMQNFNKEIS